jgi:hypothetical protein
VKLKLKPKQAVKHAGRLMQKNSPTILSAVAVAGVAATAYLTCKATWKGAKHDSRRRVDGAYARRRS